MPWSSAQHRLFEAAAHNPSIAKSHGMSVASASKMASEGVKAAPKQQAMAKVLRAK